MKNLLKSIIILALLVVLSSSLKSFAQGTDPASVYKAAVDAVNAHNVDAVTALFAPDAVVELAGDPQGIFNGQQAIQGWFKSLFDQNIHIDAGKPQVTGSVLISVDKVSLAPWQQQGVGPLDNIAQVVIQGDKIKSLVLSLTPEAEAKLTAAMAKAPAGTDPESLIRTGDALLNAHNVDAASALFTDDAIVTVVPPMPDSTGVFSGQKAIQGWLKTLADQNSTI